MLLLALDSRVTITATKANYVPGSGQTTVKSINGAAKTVTFSDYTRTAGGFTKADRWLQRGLSVGGDCDEHV